MPRDRDFQEWVSRTLWFELSFVVGDKESLATPGSIVVTGSRYKTRPGRHEEGEGRKEQKAARCAGCGCEAARSRQSVYLGDL